MMRTMHPLRSEVGRFSSRVMLGISLLLLLFCLPGLQEEYQLRDEIVELEAVIDRIEKTGTGEDARHTVYVSYEFQGERYLRIPLTYWSSDMEEGDVLTIRLHPDAPGEPRDDFLGFALGSSLAAVAVSALLCTISMLPKKEVTPC